SVLEPTWAVSDGDLEAAVGVLGVIRSVLERLEVAVAGEVDERGLAGAAGLSTQDWLVAVFGAGAPKPEVRRIAQVVAVARACRSERPTDVLVGQAVTSGAMTVEKAALVMRLVEDVRGLADPDALVADTEALVRAAWDDQDGRALSTRELIKAIRYATQLIKPAADLEADERKRRLARSLVKGTGPAGMGDYRVRLDAEGAAILDAAVEALSEPVQGPDGERDPRTAATRRADALLEVVRRGVGAPGEMPTTENAQVIVTIPWADLQDGCRGAGLTLTGELLSPGVLRRMACDARIFPMVLGAQGEVLDLGRGRRLFSPGQRKVIWRRDGHCTYPGCTIPAQWTDVHHVTWWARSGPTDIANGALLCGRHHTLVHDRDLTADIDTTGVTWHL
ncbi:HNH endonuclease signature motif containing protein, partial [Lapillicoccus sp.]|uniref:HNH endonuclease signature motif containing protein n=1 Tax=Lapillicoccus sp. TaxID=1909287 RepID=UPI0025F3160C